VDDCRALACGSSERVGVRGWCDYLKMFNKQDKKVYVFSRLYRCVGVKQLSLSQLNLSPIAYPCDHSSYPPLQTVHRRPHCLAHVLLHFLAQLKPR
jgi:hypothetical protein